MGSANTTFVRYEDAHLHQSQNNNKNIRILCLPYTYEIRPQNCLAVGHL